MKVDSMNYGFYIKNLTDGKKEAALIRDYPGLIGKGMGNTKASNKSYASIVPNFFNTSTLFADESLILNKGNMGPPPYDPDFN